MISVIIPTYNRASVIHESINSVLRQTYKKFELIIVDDGSTDNTKAVAGQYNDERIRYIYNDSSVHGPSKARNIGIDAAIGEYISFNDSDDELSEDKLEKQLSFMRETGADVIFCSMHKQDGYIPAENFYESDCTLENVLKGSFTGTPAYFGKAECFRQEHFDENLKCNEDWELMIRLLDKFDVRFQPDSLVEVAVSENSVGSDVNKALIAIDYILDKHSVLYKRYPLSQKRLQFGRKYIVALSKDLEAQKKISEGNRMNLPDQLNALYRRAIRYSYSTRMLIADKVNRS